MYIYFVVYYFWGFNQFIKNFWRMSLNASQVKVRATHTFVHHILWWDDFLELLQRLNNRTGNQQNSPEWNVHSSNLPVKRWELRGDVQIVINRIIQFNILIDVFDITFQKQIQPEFIRLVNFENSHS